MTDIVRKKNCSAKVLRLYKTEIDKYLKNKGIIDLTRYEIALKDGKLHYYRWDYQIDQIYPEIVIPAFSEDLPVKDYFYVLQFNSIPANSSEVMFNEVFVISDLKGLVNVDDVHIQYSVVSENVPLRNEWDFGGDFVVLKYINVTNDGLELTFRRVFLKDAFKIFLKITFVKNKIIYPKGNGVNQVMYIFPKNLS